MKKKKKKKKKKSIVTCITEMALIIHTCSVNYMYAYFMCPSTVVDLEGVRVVRLNPTVGPNYINFMGKFVKHHVKY